MASQVHCGLEHKDNFSDQGKLNISVLPIYVSILRKTGNVVELETIY